MVTSLLPAFKKMAMAGSKTFTSSVKADVEVAYGQVTVGFKF